MAATTLNADIPKWIEENGSIDYDKNDGGFGFFCLGGSSGCIDMDGSTLDAGDLRSEQIFNLRAGSTYQLSYWFSGNFRGGVDTMTVTFGGKSNLHQDIGTSAPFAQFFLTVTPLADTTSQIVFSHEGGDNFGLILDSVVLTETVIPEPSTVALCGLALAGAAFLRRRS